MQGLTGEELKELLLGDGEAFVASLAEAPEELQERISRAIHSLTFQQFTNLESRPIIELLLNAVDTEERHFWKTGERQAEKIVHWRMEDGRSVIRDHGEGISLTDLPKLLNPGEGGNLGVAGTTGTFGAGFLSVFAYLRNPSDRIVIRTVTASGEANQIEFFRDDKGEMQTEISALPESERNRIERGSEIEIVSSSLKAERILADARKTLQFKEDAQFILENEGKPPFSMNPQDSFVLRGATSFFETAESDSQQVRPAVTWKEDIGEKTTPENPRVSVQIIINGVAFESFSFESVGQPKTMVLDFSKYLMDYARDRGQAVSTQATLKGLVLLIQDMSKKLSPVEFLRQAHLLWPVLIQFEARTRPPKKGQPRFHPSENLKKKVADILRRKISKAIRCCLSLQPFRPL